MLHHTDRKLAGDGKRLPYYYKGGRPPRVFIVKGGSRTEKVMVHRAGAGPVRDANPSEHSGGGSGILRANQSIGRALRLP